MRNKHGVANVNGTSLYYEVAGKGEPIVLVHGALHSTRTWDEQWEFLANNYQVIRYDCRGHGKSALPTHDVYFQNEDLKALLDFLGIDKAHILGHSAGGQIAINFALTYPERIISLIAVSAGIDGYEYKGRDSFIPIFTKIFEDGYEKNKHLINTLPISLPSMRDSEVAARLTAFLDDYSGWHLDNGKTISTPHDPPAIQILEQIRCPTLIIVGELEMDDEHEMADILAVRISNSVKKVIPNVGHMPHLEAPGAYNETIGNFLAALND